MRLLQCDKCNRNSIQLFRISKKRYQPFNVNKILRSDYRCSVYWIILFLLAFSWILLNEKENGIDDLMFYNTKVKVHLTQVSIPQHIFVTLSEYKKTFSSKTYIAFHKLVLISFIGLVRFS